MQTIGPYTVLKELGRGGFGTTLLGRAPDSTLVVIKIPHADKKKAELRLRDEAHIGQRLRHPGLVHTYGSLEHEGRTCLVVRYVHGVTAEDLRARGALHPAAVALVGAQVAAGLWALHGACDENGVSYNIVHRDLSGPNILIDTEGVSQIIDLGLARSREVSSKTTPGSIFGTARYMAPEIFIDDESKNRPARDFWSLGCILYELATGEVMFDGKPLDIVRSITFEDLSRRPAFQNMPPQLRGPIDGLLCREADQRMQVANHVVTRMRELSSSLGDGRAILRQKVASIVDVVTGDPTAPLSSISIELDDAGLPRSQKL